MVSITSGFITNEEKAKGLYIIAHTNSPHFDFFSLSKWKIMSESRRQSESFYLNFLSISFRMQREASLKEP